MTLSETKLAELERFALEIRVNILETLKHWQFSMVKSCQ